MHVVECDLTTPWPAVTFTREALLSGKGGYCWWLDKACIILFVCHLPESFVYCLSSPTFLFIYLLVCVCANIFCCVVCNSKINIAFLCSSSFYYLPVFFMTWDILLSIFPACKTINLTVSFPFPLSIDWFSTFRLSVRYLVPTPAAEDWPWTKKELNHTPPHGPYNSITPPSLDSHVVIYIQARQR